MVNSMKKIVVFMGSPRKNGNTATIVEEIVRGAKAAGAETKLYSLTDMDIKHCQSCFFCRKEETCAIKDDMQAVYADIKNADAVVIASPVYMLQVTSLVKTLFDRLFPMIDANFRPRFGCKKTVMVYSQGNPDPDAFKSSFNVNASVLKVMGLDVIDTIHAVNANNSATAKNNPALMEKAFNTGKLLTQ